MNMLRSIGCALAVACMLAVGVPAGAEDEPAAEFYSRLSLEKLDQIWVGSHEADDYYFHFQLDELAAVPRGSSAAWSKKPGTTDYYFGLTLEELSSQGLGSTPDVSMPPVAAPPRD